jgi:hypothetical protein
MRVLRLLGPTSFNIIPHALMQFAIFLCLLTCRRMLHEDAEANTNDSQNQNDNDNPDNGSGSGSNFTCPSLSPELELLFVIVIIRTQSYHNNRALAVYNSPFPMPPVKYTNNGVYCVQRWDARLQFQLAVNVRTEGFPKGVFKPALALAFVCGRGFSSLRLRLWVREPNPKCVTLSWCETELKAKTSFQV